MALGADLLLKVGRSSFILNVNSFIFPGKTLPGVYARVSSVVGWIASKTSSGRSCGKPTAAGRPFPQPTPAERPATVTESSLGHLMNILIIQKLMICSLRLG